MASGNRFRKNNPAAERMTEPGREGTGAGIGKESTAVVLSKDMGTRTWRVGLEDEENDKQKRF